MYRADKMPSKAEPRNAQDDFMPIEPSSIVKEKREIF